MCDFKTNSNSTASIRPKQYCSNNINCTLVQVIDQQNDLGVIMSNNVCDVAKIADYGLRNLSVDYTFVKI